MTRALPLETAEEKMKAPEFGIVLQTVFKNATGAVHITGLACLLRECEDGRCVVGIGGHSAFVVRDRRGEVAGAFGQGAELSRARAQAGQERVASLISNPCFVEAPEGFETEALLKDDTGCVRRKALGSGE